MKIIIGAFLLSTLTLVLATIIMGLEHGWGYTFETLWIGAIMAYGLGVLGALAVWLASRWIE